MHSIVLNYDKKEVGYNGDNMKNNSHGAMHFERI